jgi:hypothetical protein
MAVESIRMEWRAVHDEWARLMIFLEEGDGHRAALTCSPVSIARRYGAGGHEQPEFGMYAVLKRLLAGDGAVVLATGKTSISRPPDGSFTVTLEVLLGAKLALWWQWDGFGVMHLRGC